MWIGLDGRHALVTGAGSGIGAAVSRALAGAGARVCLLGRDRGRLGHVAAGLTSARVLVADVTDEAQMASAFAEAGPLDILVNNAGAAFSAPFGRTSLSDWNRMLAVNLTGVFLGCRLALPAMLERGYGRIVNVASTAGLRGAAYVSAYSAAKHGVVGLTRSLALEVAGTGVTVNAVCPGYTDTDLVHRAAEKISAKTGRGAEDVVASFTARNPLKRMMTPEEVADAVLYLCRPEAAAMIGQSIIVAGGEVT